MKLCLTLAAESEHRLALQIQQYSGRVDLIEVRLDALSHRFIPQLPDSSTAFIATCRPVREGGMFRGDESERLQWLVDAANGGFDWVDLEYDSPVPTELSEGALIRSRHIFEAGSITDRTDLSSLIEPVERAPGALSKLAVAIDDTDALTRLLLWMERSTRSRPSVIIGMGELGRPSRLLGGFCGNEWSYVTPDEAVAPGQFTLRQARDCFRLDHWQGSPPLYGLLGNPVGHSLSPRLHNGLFEHYGIESLYIPCGLTGIQPWAAYLETTRLPFRGFSVTLPFKNELQPLLGAAAAGRSFNTLLTEDGSWRGVDTDSPAFLEPLRAAGLDPGWSAVVLGNGGVAAAVGETLVSEGLSVTIAGRRPEAAQELATRLGCHWSSLAEVSAAELCVNATPVGQAPVVDETPLTVDQLDFEVVYDLVYNPERTRLLELSAARGCRTLSGMEMFIGQAARQFELWTGINPDRRIIESLLLS